MTDAPHAPPNKLVLTLAHLDQWRGDLQRIDAAIAGLQSERVAAERKIAAAEFLFLEAPQDLVAVDLGEQPAIQAEDEEAPVDELASDANAFNLTPPDGKPLRRRKRQGLGFKDVILEAVASAEMGLSYAELRSAVLASPLGPKLIESDKGYHNALSRLAQAEDVIRDHGRVFTPEAFPRFMAAVERGEASTTVSQPMAHSPMGEAIVKIVGAGPGRYNGKAIIGELRKDPEFNASLTPHETGAYNIIARLVRRGQIVRRDDGLILPGRNFPKDIEIAGHDEIGAPNGNAAGAPRAGEVDASPDDNRPGLRLIS